MMAEIRQEKATKIALNTFLVDYTGSATEVYEKLFNETETDWNLIDYAKPWGPFSNYPIGEVVDFIDGLLGEILDNF